MSLQDVLYQITGIVPGFVVSDHPTTGIHPLAVPTVYDLAAGDVFAAVDSSDVFPEERWYAVVEPVGADGYGRFRIYYEDGYVGENWMPARYLDVVEVQ